MDCVDLAVLEFASEDVVTRVWCSPGSTTAGTGGRPSSTTGGPTGRPGPSSRYPSKGGATWSTSCRTGPVGRVVVNRGFKAEMARPPACASWQVEVARQGVAAIEFFAPEDTGVLKAMIQAEPSITEARVRFKAPVGPPAYDLFQEVGTGIYGPLGRYITPKRARMLSWVDRATGQRRFAHRVKGTPATRYHKRGLEALFRRVSYYGREGGRGAQRG